jgi:hypothetical protein
MFQKKRKFPYFEIGRLYKDIKRRNRTGHWRTSWPGCEMEIS